MVVDLEALMNGAVDSIPLDTAEDLSAEPLGGAAFAAPVRLRGAITNQAGIVTLCADAAVSLGFDCDRCAAPTVTTLHVPMRHTLLRALSNDADWEDYIVVPDLRLDLTALVREDVLLALPTKLLCRDDCRGLCPACGKNLNDGPCGCKKEIDPRLEGLLSLLDE
ncbi:MAG: DUF177 domain-containing protein [Clostridia bacterium]|nr:DUF177 domain-containing protein [Clostridia bacterium]